MTGVVLGALALLVLTFHGVFANGIPVQIFLDFAPFKSTWEPASGARGVAVVASNDEQVQVMTQSLPAPPPHSVYYAWLEKVEGGYLPVGALDYQSDGTASIIARMENLPYSENFSWVLVSIEDMDAIGAAPSSEIALAGRLPNPVALPKAANELPELLPVTGGAAEEPSALPEQSWTGAVYWGLAALVAASAALWTWQSYQATGQKQLRRRLLRQRKSEHRPPKF